jgi:hypothetical protein
MLLVLGLMLVGPAHTSHLDRFDNPQLCIPVLLLLADIHGRRMFVHDGGVLDFCGAKYVGLASTLGARGEGEI